MTTFADVQYCIYADKEDVWDKWFLREPERIYNYHYRNGVPAMFISTWKVNIAENPIAEMGL